MKSNVILTLVAGLAIGFIVGREWSRGGAGKPAETATGPTEIPKDWITEDQMSSAAAFAGLTGAQRFAALKFLNEKPCDCGCPHGSFAKCKKEDPNCPRVPKVVDEAVALAKQGKSADEIAAAVAKPAPPSEPPAPQGPQKVELASWTPIKGPKHAKVTIIAFSDFQCPFCARAVPTLKKIEETYPKDVRVAFRHQPLPFHNNAMPAAEASMAAHAQGKFWQMHDKLFENQQALDRPALDKYAEQLGLNMSKYRAAMDQHLHKKQIEEDSQRGNAVGANGTPTFFINGRLLSGAQPFESFKVIIDEEIKHADELLKKGTPLDKLYDAILADAKVAPAAAAPAPEEKVDVAIAHSPAKGPKSAPVTLMEFSDFQCPFCSRVVPTVKQLENDYAGKLKVVFKHQPLPFHDKAQVAAEASMAAHEQGKFWEYHDKLFENQQALDRASLERYAEELKLDMGKFRAALDSGKFKDEIAKDQADAAKAGISGTPSFLINGRKLVGAQPADAFKAIIDEELKKKK